MKDRALLSPDLAARGLTVAIDPLGAARDLAPPWRDLEARVEASFFRTWD